MKIISEAPCRVDLAGGTLDIWPLYLYHPGAVTLNFAINRWTRCVLETQETPEIRLRSGDLEAEETFASFDELHACKQPRLPLVTYVLRFFEPRTRRRRRFGIVGVDHRRCQRAEPAYRRRPQAGEASRDCAKRRGADHPCPHRCA